VRKPVKERTGSVFANAASKCRRVAVETVAETGSTSPRRRSIKKQVVRSERDYLTMRLVGHAVSGGGAPTLLSGHRASGIIGSMERLNLTY